MRCGCKNKANHVISARQLSITVTKHLRPSTALFLKFPALVHGPIAPGPMAHTHIPHGMSGAITPPLIVREKPNRGKKNAVSHLLFDQTESQASLLGPLENILDPHYSHQRGQEQAQLCVKATFDRVILRFNGKR